MFSALWIYRGFILGSVKREFQLRYRNSILGAVWTVLNPLAMILIYTVIFSQIMRAKLPGVGSELGYGVYLCSGILAWGLFAEIVTRSQNIFIENGNLLKKINFPRIILPVITILNSLLNFLIIFSIFLAYLLFAGIWPGWYIFGIIPVLLTLLILAVGLGITLGVLNVFFRDVGQFFNIFIQFWFWFTPIVYPDSILPEKIKSLLVFNPMYPIISNFHMVFIIQTWPDWGSLIYPLIAGLLLCLVGLRTFRLNVGEMVDEL